MTHSLHKENVHWKYDDDDDEKGKEIITNYVLGPSYNILSSITTYICKITPVFERRNGTLGNKGSVILIY